ncbi:unnamed protein product, partial [Adineta ricciae]
SQRLDLFTDEYLKEVAVNLATLEHIYSHGESLCPKNYYFENTGEYNIDVLKASLLNIFNIDLIQINKLQQNTSPLHSLILSNIQFVQAFIIQQDYHYYCLRRFRLTHSYFLKIDSKSITYHERIEHDKILNYLDSLLQLGANIYITIEHIAQDEQYEISLINIEKTLWPFPEAPADLEHLTILQEKK